MCGYPAISPWQVGELTEEWLDVFEGLFELREDELERIEQKRVADQAFAKVRREHPTFYNKRG